MSWLKNIVGAAALMTLSAGCSTTAQTCGSAEKTSAPVATVKAVEAVKPAAAAPSYDKPGFVTAVVKGRLWVFADGSPELTAFRETGKTPAVHATRVKAGPAGMTLIAPDLSILDAYMK